MEQRTDPSLSLPLGKPPVKVTSEFVFRLIHDKAFDNDRFQLQSETEVVQLHCRHRKSNSHVQNILAAIIGVTYIKES